VHDRAVTAGVAPAAHVEAVEGKFADIPPLRRFLSKMLMSDSANPAAFKALTAASA
jgi:hypothetical protein